MRVLYGYRWDGLRAVVDPPAAAVVAAVLAFPCIRGRLGLGESLALHVLTLTGQAMPAIRQLVTRIRSHRQQYAAGRPHRCLPASPRLKLTGVPGWGEYPPGTPSCGSSSKHTPSAQVARPGRRR